MNIVTKRDLIAAGLGAAVAIVGAGLLGCQAADRVFVESADQFANATVGPEYQAYVEADPTLDQAAKQDRFQNLESFRRAVVEAKGGE